MCSFKRREMSTQGPYLPLEDEVIAKINRRKDLILGRKYTK